MDCLNLAIDIVLLYCLRCYAFTVFAYTCSACEDVYMKRLQMLNEFTPSLNWNRGQLTKGDFSLKLNASLPNRENHSVNTASAAAQSQSRSSLQAHHLPVKKRYFIFVCIEFSCSHRLCICTSQQQSRFNMCRVCVILSAFSPRGLQKRRQRERETEPFPL